VGSLCWPFVPCFVPPLCVVIAGLFIEDGVLVTKDYGLLEGSRIKDWDEMRHDSLC